VAIFRDISIDIMSFGRIAVTLMVTIALVLSGCGRGTSAGIPPCNAILFLFGAMDVTLDCPATNAIRVLERQPK
jgi:hypothetical protein